MRHELARALAGAAIALACSPAGEAALYKSISPSGVIEFSDTPPEKGTILERVSAPREGIDGLPGSSAESRAADAMVEKANAELDLAEHALALARQGRWADVDPTRLAAPRMTPVDLQRVDFYRSNVLAARQNLMQALSMKRRAEPETYTALNTSPLLR